MSKQKAKVLKAELEKKAHLAHKRKHEKKLTALVQKRKAEAAQKRKAEFDFDLHGGGPRAKKPKVVS